MTASFASVALLQHASLQAMANVAFASVVDSSCNMNWRKRKHRDIYTPLVPSGHPGQQAVDVVRLQQKKLAF